MRQLFLLATIVLTACSARESIEPVTAPPRILNTGTTYDVTVGSGSDTRGAVVRASVDEAWRALPGVFAAFGIVPQHLDSEQKILGNFEHVVRRTLAGEPLSRYLSCGSTMSGSIADSYDVRLSVASQLLPAEAGQSLVRTRVEATARSREGVSGSPVPCGTTGRLEARIAELLDTSVAG